MISVSFVVNFCVQALVAVDFQDFAVGIDFDLALAAVGGAVEFIDFAAIVGIGVIRGHSEAGDRGLGGGEDVGRDAAGLRRTRVAVERPRGSAGSKGRNGGDEEQGFQCFHGFGFVGLD